MASATSTRHEKATMRPPLDRTTLPLLTGLDDATRLACQQTLAADETLHEVLAGAAELSSVVWRQLWGDRRPELALARRLVSRPLAKPERQLVVRRETRLTVLRDLIEHNRLDDDEQHELATGASAKLSASLAEQPWTTPSRRLPLARKAGGLTLVRELALAADDQVSDAALVELLCTIDQWHERSKLRETNLLLRVLFSRRPQVIHPVLDLIVGHDPDRIPDRVDAEGRHPAASYLLTPMCGATTLTDTHAYRLASITSGRCLLTADQARQQRYALLALINNPAVPVEVGQLVATVPDIETDLRNAHTNRTNRPQLAQPLAQVDDPDQLTWLLNRSLPNDTYGRPGRPLELLELARNPNITEQQHPDIVGMAVCVADDRLLELYRDELADSDHASLTAAFARIDRQKQQPLRRPSLRTVVDQPAAAELSKLGQDLQAWETLVGLIDAFDGPLEQLVQIAKSL